eukprot:CAMPEP_0181408638 /NCGR_PEP_ID=MMETSP1110-20121109/6403_1 /TAXON_ID=174948 /ORGANISM="Symbiodinium sp., Strain CCMP421" /LENGTH=96 /DNA_ID=CAMNT_0023531113 /DNA_START=102 /DNA_END=392 /DNA_ORIENTATION=+
MAKGRIWDSTGVIVAGVATALGVVVVVVFSFWWRWRKERKWQALMKESQDRMQQMGPDALVVGALPAAGAGGGSNLYPSCGHAVAGALCGDCGAKH